jgi:TonB family protein
MKTSTGSPKCRKLLAASALFLLCAGTAYSQEQERKVVKKVEAKYPEILKKKGIGGTVKLKVLVKADGVVKSVEVLGGNPILADSAKAAVTQWRFAPANEEASITVSVNFDPSY